MEALMGEFFFQSILIVVFFLILAFSLFSLLIRSVFTQSQKQLEAKYPEEFLIWVYLNYDYTYRGWINGRDPKTVDNVKTIDEVYCRWKKMKRSQEHEVLAFRMSIDKKKRTPKSPLKIKLKKLKIHEHLKI